MQSPLGVQAMAQKPGPLGERKLSRLAMRLAEKAVVPASPILQRLPP